jgi:hypothetical protein
MLDATGAATSIGTTPLLRRTGFSLGELPSDSSLATGSSSIPPAWLSSPLHRGSFPAADLVDTAMDSKIVHRKCDLAFCPSTGQTPL